jgi:hypothetical protein
MGQRSSFATCLLQSVSPRQPARLLLVLVFDLEKNLASQALAGNIAAIAIMSHRPKPKKQAALLAARSTSLRDALHRAAHPLRLITPEAGCPS